MKNKILLSFLLLSFSSFSSADLDYEVRGVQRVSEMFGDAVCVSLYIENNIRKSYEYNLFTTEAYGDGLSATPSVFVTKKPEFNVNASLRSNDKIRGWLCFDEPEYGWVPEEIEFSEVWGGEFLTVQID